MQQRCRYAGLAIDLTTAELIKRLHQLGINSSAGFDDHHLAQIEAVLSAAKCEEIDALCRQRESLRLIVTVLWLAR